MKTGELVKLIPGKGIVLIEFPDIGGPFRSPGNVVDLVTTEDTIIEANYPRDEVPVDQFKEMLLGQPQDGQVQVYLDDPHFGPAAYYAVPKVRLHQRGIALLAGKVIAT
jgi:hypothetical protein